MARERNLRIGPYLLAAVLLGASAIEASFAEEVHRHALKNMHTGVRPGTLRNVHARPIPTPGASDRVVRNAIGLPVVQHVERRDGERHGSPSLVQSPPAGVVSAAGSGTGGLAKAGADFGGQRIVHPNAGPRVTATALNRATIGGTAVIRVGSRPSGLGGPAKAVSGINGTAIRPKH